MAETTVPELRESLEALEKRLTIEISRYINAFQTSTGVEVTGVAVDIARLTTIGTPSQGVVASVAVSVNLKG